MRRRNVMNKNISLVIAIAVTLGQIPVSALANTGNGAEAIIREAKAEKAEGVFNLHLSIAIEKAEEITEDQLEMVVPVVANEFKAALAEAKAILNNEAATQDQIDGAFDRLSNVMQRLEFYKGDKTELINLVEQVKNLNSKEYTADSWGRVVAALS